MNANRRNLLLTTVFGAGAVGLRALATGIPASILLNPRKALAGACGPQAGAPVQYVILATSGNGDPINANVPGCYGAGGAAIPNLFTCPGTNMAPAQMTVGTQQYYAAAPWAGMTNVNASQLQFWHIMTNTPIHPKEPEVLSLMYAISPTDMFPSFLSRNLAPSLHTIQPQPVTVGAASPSEALSYGGQALPIIPPIALKDTLVAPAGPLNSLQSIRDQTLGALNDIYADAGASTAQKAFINQYVNSEQDVRSIKQSLLSSLNGLATSKYPQVDAALALIQMNVTPVVAIHLAFGGDNHHDANYTNEATQTIAAIAELDYLLGQLPGMYAVDGRPLNEAVTVISLNVFGRTLVYDPINGPGRQHNMNHQVSFVIGKPFKGGVYGGVSRIPGPDGGTVASNDFGATPMNSATGASEPWNATGSSTIQPVDTLASWGMTVAQGVGVPPSAIAAAIQPNTATGAVVCGALA